MKKRLIAFLLVLIMVLGMLPVSAMAASNSTVVLHPSVNNTVTGVKVKVGDTIDGHTVSKINGYDITVDLGEYNVNNDSFTLPYAKNIWEGVDNNQVDYISWAGGGSNKRSEGGSALLANGKNTAYYYFKGATPTPTYMYYLYYKYNDGTDSTWLTEQSGEHGTAATTFTFYVNTAKLKDRSGYDHIGWADKADAVTAKYTGGEAIVLDKDNPTKTIYAVWMPFFELKYDANGGIGAPASQTRTAAHPTVNRVTFTVPNQTPSKEGYTFKGWADSAAATTAQYQPGDTVDVKHENSPKTVYAVWEGSDPIPVPSYDDLKSAIGQIQVKDVSTPSCGTENYDLIDNTESEPFNWTKTARADQPGKYDVTIKTAPYVAKYNSEKTKTHELNNANQTTLKLVISYENSKWVLDNGLRVIEVKHSEQNPPTDIPNPNPGNIAESLKVKVVCTTTNSGHGPAFYSLIDGTFTHTDVDQSGDYPTCSITISPDSYIRQYSTDKDCPHTTSDQPKTVPLFWNKEVQKWAVNERNISLNGVIFNAVCEAVPDTFTVTYTDGVEDEVIFEDWVTTGLKYGDATPVLGKGPTRRGYTFAGWEPEVAETVTKTVTYVAKWTPVEPKAPTADDLKKLEMAVQVKCVVDAAQQHTDAYGLLGEYDKDYFVGEPKKVGDDWLCDISYDPDPYVAEFNKAFPTPKHIQNDEKIVPVTLIWAGDSWQIKTQGRVHVTEEYTVTYTDGVDGEEVFADQVYSDLRKDSTTPAFNGTPTRTGYTFAGWEPEVAATVTQTVTYVAKWEKKTYKVVAKLYVNGKPAYYQNEDFYTYEVSGLYGEAIDFDTIKAKAVEQAKQIKKASASYTAVILEDHEPNPVCTTFGEHQPGQATHYVKVNVKTEENVVIFQSFEGKTDLTKLHTTTAPYGTNVVEFLNDLGLDLEVAGYTLDTDEDGNTNWYKKDSPKWTFGANDTINGWTNVLLKYTITPHNIYAFARLNSAFAPLTSVEFGEFVKLNDATLTRLGLGSYNANNYISIGTFSFNKLPLMGDDFMSYYGDEEFDAVVAELADNIVLETGVSKEVAEKIAWTYLFKVDNSDYMTEAGYPTDDENGYQLSGNLNLATVMFKANGENVTGMPTVNYTYDDIFEIHDFYFAGDTFTMPADPTREGYSFEGWSVKVIPDENDADHLDADGADDAADETLLKAGDTYTITAGGVIFTAQWKLNTYIIASDLRINGDTANLADGKTYAWTHRYGGNYGETIDYQPMFDALKVRALAVDAANEPYDAEIKLCFPGNKNKLFNETILTYGQEGGGWNPGVKNTAYIWGYATTSYEVIFNSDGGSAVDTQIVKYGEKAVKPEDPTMKGYNFLGWFDKDGNPFDFDTEITHKTELKAQWEKKDYIIASDLRVNGGEAVKDEGKTYAWTHRYGGKYEETIDYQPMFDALKARALEADKDNEPNPTKVDVELRFPGSSNLFNETILTYGQDGANWQAANNTAYIWGYAWTYYDVTFVTPEGATTVDAQLIKNGDCAAKPADPTKEGWKFLGWYADAAFKTEFNFDAPITKKTSVYAKFELTSTPIGDIYVRYDVLHIKQLPDGTYDLANAEVEHLSAKKDTTVTAVIKDYRATHHVNVNRTLSKLTGTAIQPYKGVDGKPVYTILTVYYDLDFHTLTFDTMGGSKIAPETVRHGLTVAKPKDPVNGGYIFDGWYTDKTFRHRYDFSTPLTEDITIYAKWFLIVLPGVTVKKNTPKLNTADHFAYVQGYPDGTVKPAGNITRAETAAILFRLMDDASRKTYYSTKSGFRDVASGSWYNTYVATLNNAGVITDSSNGYFRPNEAITRAELAAMLAKFSETTSAANYFNDVSAKYWAANAIAICAKLGWITGYPDGTFRPDRNVTRAELMAMINRATGRAPKSADAFLPGMKTWIDNTSDKWYYLDVQEATNSHSYTVKGSETWTALTSDPNWSLYE